MFLNLAQSLKSRGRRDSNDSNLIYVYIWNILLNIGASGFWIFPLNAPGIKGKFLKQ